MYESLLITKILAQTKKKTWTKPEAPAPQLVFELSDGIHDVLLSLDVRRAEDASKAGREQENGGLMVV